MRFSFCLVVIYVLSLPWPLIGQTDSLNQSRWSFDGFVSITSLTNVNWNKLDYTSVNMAMLVDLGNRKTTKRTTRKLDLRAELAYQKFIDSVWIKTTDRIYLSSQWLIGSRRIKFCVLINLKTQITDTWEADYGNPEKLQWQGGPLLPANLNLGPGLSWKPTKSASLDFIPAGIQVRSMPAPGFAIKRHRILIENSIALVQYRISTGLQWTIDQKINNRVRWKCKGDILSSLTDTEIDVHQTLSIEPLNHFRISLDQKIIFDSVLSKRLQMRIEMRIGCYWGRE